MMKTTSDIQSEPNGRIVVLSSTKERNGIADYTKQLFRAEFLRANRASVVIRDISFGAVIRAPFQRANILHIQHEFFMFDRFVGVSAIPTYLYLWLMSSVSGYKLITTLHSVYDVAALESALPHFRRYHALFPILAAYLRFHLLLVSKCSHRTIVLTEAARENMARFLRPRDLELKVRKTPLGNYAPSIQPRDHGLLLRRFGITGSTKIFTLFGFAFPAKGYEYAIQAMDILVNHQGRHDVKLLVVSGEPSKRSAPGGGQGRAYLDLLKKMARELDIEAHVLFTGYLANEEPLLEEIFAKTRCFIFPYLNRPFASAAVATAMASGKPLLVTNAKCFEEFDDLPSVSEADPAALASKMTRLMDDPDYTAAAADSTRHNADKFGMDKVFARHMEIYREASSRRVPD